MPNIIIIAEKLPLYVEIKQIFLLFYVDAFLWPERSNSHYTYSCKVLL